MRIDKSSLFRTAHAIYKRAETSSFAEALKYAWKALKLKARMAMEVVEFQYKKLNGEIRKASGTLKNIAEFIKGNSGNKTREDLMCYFDVEKKGFRSFIIINLI